MFAYLVLHYKNADVTEQCIQSLLSNDMEDSCIVIVDNASPNGSGKELEEYYEHSEKVTVLLSEENLGFAKGNNIGYQYCVQKLKSDFVCALNNDTLLIQKNFFSLIENRLD